MLLKDLNILVLDDVALICNFLYGVANKIQGCNAFKAFDYKTASDILESESIDLLITDIELKQANGIDLISKIRSGGFSSTAHNIPIIVLSVNSYKELIEQCVRFDVNDFLVKPISSVKLTEKIYQHLQIKKVIKQTNYYSSIIEGSKISTVPKEYSRRGVSIVLDVKNPLIEESAEKAQQTSNDVVSKRAFLDWPEGATTGHYQLDRRLKNVAYAISYFYDAFIENRKHVAIENARKRACESVDYLLYIGKNIQQYEYSPDFLEAFTICLSKLEVLITQIASANLKNRNQILALLRKLASWWSHTCSRRLLQNVGD